ncbi:hypothetical protein DY000_02035372 [Brassica cretica]|uniref:Uncharacterized protein n=1 Tax=Brassica cretica TaxID=69181 RepID=A0ABQ7DN86_BRACR|nr:hypothetical protein DY000_02035372 [Brassica cretica]
MSVFLFSGLLHDEIEPGFCLSFVRIVFLKRRSLLLSERKRKLLGALRDSSQSEAVGASRACCFTEWSSGNMTQDEADVSTRVTELGVEESRTWE